MEGENLSAATVALSGSALALTATAKAGDAISVAGLNLTVTDAKGTLSAPVFIAVPAGAAIDQVSVFVPKEAETMKIPSTASDKEGVDYVTIAGKKWAKWNVGANSPSDYGWYFAWAGTEGYVRYANTWQLHDATSIEFSYTLSSSKTAVASDYLYVKTQTFITGHSFYWEHTPYHTGSNQSTGFTKYIPTAKSSYWSGSGDPDNKLVLDPEDDAAAVNWGGTWRMPTSAEFKALKAATYWAWDATDKGYYVYAPNPSTDKGKKNGEGTGTYVKSNALLFFPTAGYGMNGRLIDTGSVGGCWSSSLYSNTPSRACGMSFHISNEFDPQGDSYRFYGKPVRPLSD